MSPIVVFFEWLQGSALSVGLRSSDWVYPLINLLHRSESWHSAVDHNRPDGRVRLACAVSLVCWLVVLALRWFHAYYFFPLQTAVSVELGPAHLADLLQPRHSPGQISRCLGFMQPALVVWDDRCRANQPNARLLLLDQNLAACKLFAESLLVASLAQQPTFKAPALPPALLQSGFGPIFH